MIPLFKVRMAANAGLRVQDVLQSGQIAEGPVVKEFEKALGEVFLGHPSSTFSIYRFGGHVAVNSGTAALDIALQLAEVEQGDDVLISPQTCAASIVPIVRRNARPVWCDIDTKTGNISPASIKERINDRVKAIVTVDWGGNVCDHNEIAKIITVHPNKPLIIEDAAHSFGAKGTRGNIACFSFQAIKLLTTGDGGSLLLPETFIDRAKRIRWFGLDRTGNQTTRHFEDIHEVGFKYHMNDIAAAIGIANLANVDNALKITRNNAFYISSKLNDLVNGKKLIQLPNHYGEGTSNWLFTILVDNPEAFRIHMMRRGITVSQVHRRCDTHPAFAAAAGKQEPLPGVDYFSKHQTNIPVGWWLTEDEINRIIWAIEDYVKTKPSSKTR